MNTIKSADPATRAAIADRLRRCLPPVKADIAAWSKNGIIPARSLEFDIDGTVSSISVADLVATYGFEPILAFIYFDDLVVANLSDDKRSLISLLEAIPAHGARHALSLEITPAMLDTIRTSSPSLWQEYLRLQSMPASE